MKPPASLSSSSSTRATSRWARSKSTVSSRARWRAGKRHASQGENRGLGFHLGRPQTARSNTALTSRIASATRTKPRATSRCSSEVPVARVSAVAQHTSGDQRADDHRLDRRHDEVRQIHRAHHVLPELPDREGHQAQRRRHQVSGDQGRDQQDGAEAEGADRMRSHARHHEKRYRVDALALELAEPALGPRLAQVDEDRACRPGRR